MEKIAWRAVKAICIIGLLFGGAVLALGWHAYDSGAKQYAAASKEAWETFDTCKSTSGSSGDSEACLTSWRFELALAEAHARSSKQGGRWVVGGFIGAVVVPLLALAAFYLFRWIFTGRWRDAPASLHATRPAQNSA